MKNAYFLILKYYTRYIQNVTKIKRWIALCGNKTCIFRKAVLHVSTLRTKATFSRGTAADMPFKVPFDLASRLFHCPFCTRRLFHLVSLFLSPTDSRCRGKVICCLSRETQAAPLFFHEEKRDDIQAQRNKY